MRVTWLGSSSRAIENTTVGTFNVFGPSNHPEVQLTMRQLIDAGNQVTGNKATPTWVDTAFLTAHEIHPWSDMPAGCPRRPTTLDSVVDRIVAL